VSGQPIGRVPRAPKSHVILTVSEWERIADGRPVYEVCPPTDVQPLTRTLPGGQPEECVRVAKDLLSSWI